MKYLLLVLLGLPFIGFGQKVCISGNCENGQGTCTYANGDKYVGEFMNGKKNGQGSFTFGKGEWEGDKCLGEWMNDMLNGQGTYTWASGNKYVGEFKDDKKHGQGTYTFSDGRIEKGLWENNKYVGE